MSVSLWEKGEGIFPIDGSGLLTLLRVFANNSSVIWGLQAHLCSGTWDIEILEVRPGSKHRQQLRFSMVTMGEALSLE